MDIWEWVGGATERLRESGRSELAEAVLAVPRLAVAGEPGEAEDLASQIIEPIRELDEPWLEVFVRHTVIAGRLLRFGVGEPLREEIDTLLELARRPENAKCPQSTCAVHDHTQNLSNIDGPGYAAERIDALEEVLPRVGPDWSCYPLTMVEYARALADAGRTADALDRLDEAIEAVAGRGDSWELPAEKARLLIAEGRHEEALEALPDEAGIPDEDPGPALAVAVLRTTALAGLGRPQEALNAFPSQDDIGPRHMLWVPWATAYERLTGAGVMPNSWEAGAELRRWADVLDQVGAHRSSLELALTAGRLAVDRRARWVAGRLVLLAEAKLAGLRSAEGAAAEVERLRAAVDALPLTEPTAASEELAARFDSEEDETDPERWTDLLEVAASRDPSLAGRLALAMVPTGHVKDAVDRLWAIFEDSPEDGPTGQLLASLLLRRSDDDGIERLAGLTEEAAPVLHHGLLAQWHFGNERYDQVGPHCERVLELDPGQAGALRLWAQANRMLGEWSRAQELFSGLVAAGEPGSEERHNDLLSMAVCATAVRDWATVRQACAEIGVELDEPEGPVDEDWGVIQVAVPLPDGESRLIPALRTGPATARLLLPQPAGMPFNTRDVLVIEPQPLAEPPDDPAEAEDFLVPFPAIATLEHAGYTSYFFDGVHPGDEIFERFMADIRSRGWDAAPYSGPDYTVITPDGEELTGVFGWIALPPDVDPSIAENLLDEMTEDWEHPLAWVELARAAGVDVPYHEKIVADYGL